MNKIEQEKSPGIFDIVKSILAAVLGVQSDANRERDFNSGKASHYIIGGIIFVVIFILTLVSIVSSVLEASA
jgi:hypothetical protein